MEIAEGCVLKCAEGSFNVPQRLRYVYDGSSWVFVREEKVWNVSGVQSSAWRDIGASNRKLGVDIYRSSTDRTAEPLADDQTGLLSLVNDSTKVTYTRDGKSEHPSIIVGCNAYVADCFKGDTIGATDIVCASGIFSTAAV